MSNNITITNEKNRKAARVALRSVAKAKGITVKALVRKIGPVMTVEDYLEGARQQIKAPSLSIGDVVVAEYYGTIVCGRIHAFDGSGWVYLTPTHAGSCDHKGMARDSLGCSPHQRESFIKIGRKPFAEVKSAPQSCMGGVYGV